MAAAAASAGEATRLAVVTGANTGIGKEIARALGKAGGVHVIATSRDGPRGEAAVAELVADGASVEAAVLDISDPASVAAFAAFVDARHGGVVDILINNAGMAYKGDVFGAAEARITLATNLFGTIAITEALLPALRKSAVGARIVNVCSEAGHLKIVAAPVAARLQDPRLTKAGIITLADEFVAAIEADNLAAAGWPRSMYGVSKLLEVAYTYTLASELAPAGIVVNAVCPGYCATAMSSYGGPRTPAQGAETPVWCALRPGRPADITSGFYSDKTLIAW